MDVDNLLVSQPDHGEQALEIAAALTGSGAIDVVVIDSVAALVPKAELEGEMGDSHMGLHARLMSQALRKLTGVVSRTGTCMVFINQIREKIGVMFGNPETTTGGRALKFYASVRVDIRRIAAHQGWRQRDRQSHPRQGGEEQSRAAVSGSGVRHPVRRRHLAGGRPAGSGRDRTTWWRRADPGSAITANASARAATTPDSSCASIPIYAGTWMASCARHWGLKACRNSLARPRQSLRSDDSARKRPFDGPCAACAQKKARKQAILRMFSLYIDFGLHLLLIYVIEAAALTGARLGALISMDGVSRPPFSGGLRIRIDGENQRRSMASQRMTQTQLVRSLAESCEVNNKVARQFLDSLSSMAIAEVKKNGVFVLPGIGRLVRQDRKARVGRNPATGETIKIPAKKVVKFRVAKAAKDAIVPPKKASS